MCPRDGEGRAFGGIAENFSQEDEKEITVECGPTVEERATDSMDLVDLCEELEALERRVKMQRHIIQQVKLEIDGEKMHDAGASSASTRGETTQRLSVPLNHFRILNAGVSCKYFSLLIEN
jgi:hypothetical protein